MLDPLPANANTMQKLTFLLTLTFGFCLSANADVWSWTDTNGVVRYVTSTTPIYTWVDSDGSAYYADNPGHEDAVRVRLLWHSKKDVAEAEPPEKEQLQASMKPQESDTQKSAREMAEAYYCNQATEVYNSYVGAKKLYTTNESGEREYLSGKDRQAKMAETKAAMNQWCG